MACSTILIGRDLKLIWKSSSNCCVCTASTYELPLLTSSLSQSIALAVPKMWPFKVQKLRSGVTCWMLDLMLSSVSMTRDKEKSMWSWSDCKIGTVTQEIRMMSYTQLQFIEHLPGVRHCSKYFTHINSLILTRALGKGESIFAIPTLRIREIRQLIHHCVACMW